MPEASGSMSGDRKRSVAEWPSYRAILDFTKASVRCVAVNVRSSGVKADMPRQLNRRGLTRSGNAGLLSPQTARE